MDPQRNATWCVWVYVCPAADTPMSTSVAPFGRRHMASALASDTVSPDAAPTLTTTVTIFWRLCEDRDSMPVSLAYSMPYSVCTSALSRQVSEHSLAPIPTACGNAQQRAPCPSCRRHHGGSLAAPHPHRRQEDVHISDRLHRVYIAHIVHTRRSWYL